MKVTRIAYSKGMNASKYAQLEEQAKRLGRVRSEVWQRFGSINGVTMRDRQIRDGWLKEGKSFDVPANAWKETLRDAKADIAMAVEAAKVKARQAIRRLGLLNQDSSCTEWSVSTESELPKHAQEFAGI
jgi:hypothetical protein